MRSAARSARRRRPCSRHRPASSAIACPLKIVDAAPSLVSALTAEPDGAANAILTADTRAKVVSRVVAIGGKDVTLTAIGKGAR